MRIAALVALALAAVPASALAQKGESEYQKPAHLNADEVAILFLSGRYIMPVTCKLMDGSTIDVEDSVVVKGAPEQGGGKQLKATFYGIQVENAEYCYSRDRSPRAESARRAATCTSARATAPSTASRTSGAWRARARSRTTRTAASSRCARSGPGRPRSRRRCSRSTAATARIVVEGLADGTDGGKLVSQYFAEHPPAEGQAPRVFGFRVFAKDESEFMFYAIEDTGRRR